MADSVGMLLWIVVIVSSITILAGFVGAFALATRPLSGTDIALIPIIALPLGYHLLSEAGLFLPVVFGSLLASIALTWRGS